MIMVQPDCHASTRDADFSIGSEAYGIDILEVRAIRSCDPARLEDRMVMLLDIEPRAVKSRHTTHRCRTTAMSARRPFTRSPPFVHL